MNSFITPLKIHAPTARGDEDELKSSGGEEEEGSLRFTDFHKVDIQGTLMAALTARSVDRRG